MREKLASEPPKYLLIDSTLLDLGLNYRETKVSRNVMTQKIGKVESGMNQMTKLVC